MAARTAKAPLDVETAVSRARTSVRFVRKDTPHGVAWSTIDRRTKSGRGVYGTEEQGRDDHEKQVMFLALARIDRRHDWHAYDWHTLTGSADDRVRQMLAWRAEYEEARSTRSGFDALIGLMIADAHRSIAR